jgi:hypothetical protein
LGLLGREFCKSTPPVPQQQSIGDTQITSEEPTRQTRPAVLAGDEVTTSLATMLCKIEPDDMSMRP